MARFERHTKQPSTFDTLVDCVDKTAAVIGFITRADSQIARNSQFVILLLNQFEARLVVISSAKIERTINNIIILQHGS